MIPIYIIIVAFAMQYFISQCLVVSVCALAVRVPVMVLSWQASFPHETCYQAFILILP